MRDDLNEIDAMIERAGQTGVDTQLILDLLRMLRHMRRLIEGKAETHG